MTAPGPIPVTPLTDVILGEGVGEYVLQIRTEHIVELVDQLASRLDGVNLRRVAVTVARRLDQEQGHAKGLLDVLQALLVLPDGSVATPLPSRTKTESAG